VCRFFHSECLALEVCRFGDNSSTDGLSRLRRLYLRRMPRLPRSALPDGFFHVWTRGVATTVAFSQGADRTELLRLLGQTVRSHGWELYAACVLSTHYHLVVDATVKALSDGMRQLNWRYALYFNDRYESFGHVFAERFKTRALHDESRVYDTCGYVLLNPVKAGLCQRSDEWPWSYSRYGLYAT
jgi:putative transposase